MEIMAGVERRRRWSDDDKLRVVAQSALPGASLGAIARRHDISRSLLWYWRKQARAGRLTGTGSAQFIAVRVASEVLSRERCVIPSTEPGSALTAAALSQQEGGLEITLPDGTVLRTRAQVGASTMRRILSVLRG
jgi:transposase